MLYKIYRLYDLTVLSKLSVVSQGTIINNKSVDLIFIRHKGVTRFMKMKILLISGRVEPCIIPRPGSSNPTDYRWLDQW